MAFEREVEPVAPLTGNDLELLRKQLSRGRAMSRAEFMFELGLQRPRYADLLACRDKPILKPRVEILLRMLMWRPELSIVQEEHSVNEAIELLNSARPERHYTPRDLAVLLGAEASAGHTWADGGPMTPSTKRVLRALVRVLRSSPPKDRARILDEYEAIVLQVAKGHGLDADALMEGGFSGYRVKRRAAKAESDDD